MAVLYVDEYGALIRYSAGRVIVEKDGTELASVRVQELESVVVQENASLTSAAIAALLRAGAAVAFLTRHGEYAGKLESVLGKNVCLRRKQYKLAEDEKFCTNLAKRFVAAKLANMRTIVMRYARAEAQSALQTSVEAIKRASVAAGAADTLEEIVGFEGVGSREYFHALALVIHEPFKFEGRNRRPPRDPVNAMLGFAYALLENHIERAVSVCGLDPYCGFLHRECYGRQGLVLDLMEEFRPVVADSVVVTACNQHRLKPDEDFENRDGGVYMNESGRRKFFAAFESRMRQSIRSPSGKQWLTYEKLCDHQARLLAACVSSAVPDYRPFLVK